MADLKKYNQKRNFKSSTEPLGEVNKVSSNRFVVQFHQARTKHFDFRLEHGGVLLSFAIPKNLSTDPKDKRLAIMVEDHPVSYINFQGEIPKGNYGAGTVEIYDAGTYSPLADFDEGLKKGHLKFNLNGKIFKGAWSLFRINENNWIISKLADEFAGKTNIVKNPFSTCDVQLATLSKNIPSGKNWSFEIKYDGFRAVSFIEGKTATIFSRNGNIISNRFKNIAKNLEILPAKAFVVDGEIVCFDNNGRSNFSLLQNNIKHKKTETAFYVVFDLLALNGKDLRETPLKTRRNKLKTLMSQKTVSNIIFSEDIEGHGDECFEFAKENKLEGIIAKDQTSKYLGGRNKDWLKIKCEKIEEFICLGFLKSEDKNNFKSLLVGQFVNGKLTFMGHVGTGFSESKKRNLLNIFMKNISKNRYLIENFDKNYNSVVWLKSKFVAVVKFTEITSNGFLRHPSFQELKYINNANKTKVKYEK